MRIVAAIPARLESSRLPKKVLLDIAGRPMLWRVWSRCRAAFSNRRVYIATDSQEVRRQAQAWKARVLMTGSECRSGTERIAAALERIEGDVILNVQGDEPMIDPRLLKRLARVCAERDCVVTPVFRIQDARTLEDPNTVKVVRDHDGNVMYFSRAAIPFFRDSSVAMGRSACVFWPRGSLCLSASRIDRLHRTC